MFNKLFGKKSEKPNPPAPASNVDPAKDPNMIRVFDEYGRELFITKQQWRDNVLLGNLEKVRDDPEQLSNMIISAIRDGFAADTVKFAEHLKRIDPIPSRSATLLGIVYLEVNRLDEAQQVLDEYIRQYGEDGVVLTNLAKVYSLRGDASRAETTLWHALELDPNQENGLGWYAVMQKERHGDEAYLEAFRRVSKLPGSWRAKIWLARDALQHKDLSSATMLYKEAMTLAGDPAPADLLMQISGDLGNAGYLTQILDLVSPHFDPAWHGLQVGNNLIKANLDLGHIEEAKRILEQLYNQNRPDWKPTLNFWDTEIAKVRTSQQAAQQTTPEQLSVSMIGIEGPLWMRDQSPFAALMPGKVPDAARVAIIGSTAIMQNLSDKPFLQLTDAPGRFSRAIPLALGEWIHLQTDAMASAIIPWAIGRGFALFGQPYEDGFLCQMLAKGEFVPRFVVGLTIDATQPAWKLHLRLLQQADGARLEETSVECTENTIGVAVEQLSERLTQWLVKHANVQKVPQPDWYQSVLEPDKIEYLVRLEQQLAVLCKHVMPNENFGLHGEREILDGALQLCLRQPTNPTVRMLYAQTLREMKKARPDILPEYKEKIEQLQQKYPLSQEIEVLLEQAYAEAFE